MLAVCGLELFGVVFGVDFGVVLGVALLLSFFMNFFPRELSVELYKLELGFTSDFDLVLLLFLLFFLPIGGSKLSDLNPAAQILVAGSILNTSFCGDLLGDVITPAGTVVFSLNSVEVGDITCLGVLFEGVLLDGVLLFVLLMLLLLVVVFGMLLVFCA